MAKLFNKITKQKTELKIQVLLHSMEVHLEKTLEDVTVVF